MSDFLLPEQRCQLLSNVAKICNVVLFPSRQRNISGLPAAFREVKRCKLWGLPYHGKTGGHAVKGSDIAHN